MAIEKISNAVEGTKLIDLGKGTKIDDVTALTNGAPLSGGIFSVAKADDGPFDFTYKYDEIMVILEGEIDNYDKKADTTTSGKAGDVLSFPKGTEVQFSSKSYGRAFFVAHRPFREF